MVVYYHSIIGDDFLQLLFMNLDFYSSFDELELIEKFPEETENELFYYSIFC